MLYLGGLSARELRTPAKNFCKGVEPGDTIEFHWVHNSCDVAPGQSLGSCLSTTCANPDLRVETQVFTVVNDRSAADFGQMSYAGLKPMATISLVRCQALQEFP